MTPKHEDNNFYRGLIIGGLLAAIAIGVGFLVNLYNNSGIEHAIELKNRVVDEEEDVSTAEESDSNVVELTTIDGVKYYVVSELSNDNSNNVMRLLSTKIESLEEPDCILASDVILTFWSDNGDRLVRKIDSIDIALQEVDIKYEDFPEPGQTTERYTRYIEENSCIELVKWLDRDVVITVNTEYLNAVGMKTRVVLWDGKDIKIGVGQEQSLVTSTWNYGLTTLIQEVNKDLISDVYYFVEFPGNGDLNYDNVALKTNYLFKADITSDYNLRNYEKGLKGEINGEEVILLWDQN